MQGMNSASLQGTSATAVDAPAVVAELAASRAENAELREQLASVKQQLDSLKKLLFGPRSEKRTFDIPGQEDLFGRDASLDEAKKPKKTVAEHERGTSKKNFPDGCVNDEGLRFDDTVPVKTISLEPDGLKDLSPDEYEIIGTEKRYKLAQQAASYTVLCYEQPIIKLTSSGDIMPTLGVPAVLERSLADVSFLAGTLVDKFSFHLPLYRQHQRLEAAGITLARSTLTNLARRAIMLLEPIVESQRRNILCSKVLAMDETPIKAGKSKTKKGRMNQGYFWPIYGEDDEVAFIYADSRARRVVEGILSTQFGGTIVTDGYAAYASFCKANAAITHAQCWAHGRRKVFEAQESEPERAAELLDMIGALYAVEKVIREDKLEGAEKLALRQKTSAPIVDAIFAFVTEQRLDPSLTPKNPFAKALQYLDNRRAELSVFLADPDVPIDTNHLERSIRSIAMGRRAWMFCWTELGAEHVGIIQSLITTCKLHGVDPYVYLVDVLQRVGDHPASDVIALTPRLWKTRFADDPLRSDLAGSG